MRVYIALFLLFLIPTTHAQVGIGTTTPNAQLEITSSNQAAPANSDGILIPKIDAFPATPPTALQQGMLVYLTTTVGANAPGFYFWNNTATSWVGIQSSSNADWNILGNTGTSSATNFLGTTDDKDIVLKRNNIRAGFIGNPNTASGNKNTSFGANTLNSTTLGTRNTAMGTNIMPSLTTGSINVGIGEQTLFTNTTGSENVAVGVGSLYLNLSGSFNTAIGRNAMTSNSSGGSNTGLGYAALLNNANSFNTAIGRDAMRTNTSGSENTAAGVNALYANVSGIGNAAYGVKSLRNTTGSYNVGSGYESLFTNGSGNNNIGLGYQSLYTNATGNNNIAVGYQAGYSETGSNRLYIENSNADASNALIYGEFDNNILRTNGTLQIGNPATTGYALPTPRGTSGQVLQTDGAGNTAWAAVPVNTVKPFVVTGASSGIYTVSLTEYTIRVYNGVSEVMLPNAVGNTGKVYIIIGSNGIGSKILSTNGGGGVYDDVTNATITAINANERYMVQSDGAGWLVIGR